MIKNSTKPIKTVMIAPGYGNQTVGMGKEFYDNFRLFQENFEHASQCLGYNVTRLCFAASSADLLNPIHSYVAQFSHTYTIAQMLREEFGIYPDAVLGYGIGTIGALAAAETLNFVDGIYVAKKFLEKTAAVKDIEKYSSYRVSGLFLDDIAKISSKEFSYKIVSSDSLKSHIVSCKESDFDDLLTELKKIKRSVKTYSMGLGHGLGLDIMQDVIKIFKPYLNKVDFFSSNSRLISCVNAKNMQLRNSKIVESELLESLSMPLQWLEALKKLNSFDCVIVLGPSKILRAGIQEQLNNKKLFFIDNISELVELKKFLNVSASINSEIFEKLKLASY